MENLFDDSVVEILSIAFAGFAFLLALLTYLIIRKEASRERSVRKSVLKLAYAFMAFSVVLCVMNLIFLSVTSSNGQLNEESKVKISAYDSMVSVCERERFNCQNRTQAGSFNESWQSMTTAENAICGQYLLKFNRKNSLPIRRTKHVKINRPMFPVNSVCYLEATTQTNRLAF